MTGNAITGIIAAILATVVLLVGGVTVVFGGSTAAACTVPAPSDPPTPSPSGPPAPAGPGRVRPVGRFDAEQVRHAATITAVGAALRVPIRGQIIAVATAIQESDLRNLDHGDQAGPDSRGLFQQRTGWGPLTDRMNPTHAARMFYTGGSRGQDGLLDIPNWPTLPLTEAAQAVQRSGTPHAYARHEPDATILLTALTSLGGKPEAVLLDCVAALAAPANTPAAAAVTAMLRVALNQVGKPYAWAAEGPDAFDCSGLVVYAWAQAGYHLPVRTAERMRQTATPIPAGQEQPGDLIFSQFHTERVPNGAAHVAIVNHPGTLIEAPGTGLRLRVRTYNSTNPELRYGRLPSSALRAGPR